MERILLGNRKSKRSVNVDNKVTLELKTNERLLPSNDVVENVNLFDVYNNEKNKSNNYRLIFSINPLCTNVLFNAISEIVYREGANDVVVVPVDRNEIKYSQFKGNGKPKNNESIYTRQCIRDTEYSHPNIGPYVYHCGYDIFNNHTLRSDDFILINDGYNSALLNSELKNDKIIETDYDNSSGYSVLSTFNTIRDYCRYENGTPLREIYFQRKNTNINSISDMDDRIVHNYQVDNLYTFLESVTNNISEENGWFGFINPSNIDLPSYGDIILNKCMNNNKPCEFIDMYPDRSLFSFNPKVNTYRNNRVEKNWNYCLTYPYRNSYNNELVFDSNNSINGIFVKANKISIGDYNGRKVILFKTPINHNLAFNSYIQLYIYKNNSYVKVDFKVKIEGIGDLSNNNTSRSFYIGYEDIIQYLDYDEDNNKILNDIRFSKIVNGIECQYYIREFKRIPNLKFANKNIEDIDNDKLENFINENLFIENDGKYELLEFDNTLSKLAFSQNIYQDKLSQIVFTDDIKLDKIYDNLNRPLSEIYLTIIKNNKGYSKWYNEKDYGSEEVEFSHAFGFLSAGIDMDIDDRDYNVHCIHNIGITDNDGSEYSWNDVLKIPKSGKILVKPLQVKINDSGTVYYEDNSNDGIVIEDTVFNGDIVEFNPSEIIETTIEPIYYRFNTAQREINFTDGRENIYIDVLKSDDYDLSQESNYENGYNQNVGFKVSEDIYNKTADGNLIYPGNLFPEGYYYQPHYKIKINEFSTTINQDSDTVIKYFNNNDKKPEFNNDLVTITTIVNYYFEVNDEVILYNTVTHDIHSGIVVSIEESYKRITIKTDIIITKDTIVDYRFFKKNRSIPNYAYYIKDGTGRYLWKNLLKKSELSYTSDLNDITFTNNAFYIEKNINFYLRRQDPYGDYGLKYVEGKTGSDNNLANLDISGNKFDTSYYNYILEENNSLC